jgi:hypothetical protein
VAFECSIEGRLGLVSDIGGDIATPRLLDFSIRAARSNLQRVR